MDEGSLGKSWKITLKVMRNWTCTYTRFLSSFQNIYGIVATSQTIRKRKVHLLFLYCVQKIAKVVQLGNKNRFDGAKDSGTNHGLDLDPIAEQKCGENVVLTNVYFGQYSLLILSRIWECQRYNQKNCHGPYCWTQARSLPITKYKCWVSEKVG